MEVVSYRCLQKESWGVGEKVAVIGTGYAGLSTGACLAEIGHQVLCADIDAAKIAGLNRGEIPIHEPGLDEWVRKHLKSGALRFTSDTAEAASFGTFVFMTVGTPVMPDGEVDMRQMIQAVTDAAPHIRDGAVIVVKSTVPAGTTSSMELLANKLAAPGICISTVSNPEFLREGTALQDAMKPDRIIIGADSVTTADRVSSLYETLDAPVLITDRESAELIKYASNTFLALKVSFINEIANVCEKIGADITMVAEGLGMDRRIGPHFLRAGIGYGGFCLPKDTRAQLRIAENVDYDMMIVRAVIDVNQKQRIRFVNRIVEVMGGSLAGKTLAVMGLAFKPDTDDMRDAPSIDIMNALQRRGAILRAHDPVVWRKEELVGDLLRERVRISADPYETLEQADGMIVVTEWNSVRQLDLDRVKSLMNTPVIADGRNVFEPAHIRSLGFTYISIGRP